MKNSFLLLSFCLFSLLLVAQKKTLPACPSVATEIAKINSTFDQLVLNATKDVVYPPTTICSVKGMFETVEGMANFTFKFSDEDYIGKQAVPGILMKRESLGWKQGSMRICILPM